MTLDCPRRELLDAAQLAGAAATGRSTNQQILQSILVEAQNDRVRLVGCDGQMWVERRMPAQISRNGALAVQARLFNEILSQLPDGEVHVEQPNGTSLRLTLQASEYRVVGMPPQDFPEVPDVGAETTLKMKASDFARMVESVNFAVAKDNHGRPYLTGVLFNYDGENLEVVATDTHRLALRKEAFPGLGQPVRAVVPERALNVICRLPVSPDGELTLTFGDNRMMVGADSARVVTQLFGSEYVPYERVIPSSYTRSWQMDRETFSACLRRAGVLAKESAMRVNLRASNNVVTISTRSEGVGEGKDEMDIIQHGDDIEIAFNGGFLLQAIEPITSDGVVLQMTENDRAAVIRPTEPASGYLCVIMPMAL